MSKVKWSDVFGKRWYAHRSKGLEEFKTGLGAKREKEIKGEKDRVFLI